MIKGLERVEQLRIDINTSKDKLNDIEKELKDYQELKEQYEILNKELSDLHERTLRTNFEDAKKLTALEFIKNKGVFVHLLQQSQNMEEYNSLMLVAFKKMAERDYKGAVEKFCLTQEEYSLLKEVLI